MNLIILFFICLVILFLLVVFRAYEIRRSKKFFLLSLISKFDRSAENFIDGFKFRLLQAIQTTRYIVLVWSKDKALFAYERSKERAIREIDVRKDLLLGKKEIGNKGAVSFYLKKIKEEKSSMVRGKINEEF